MFFFISFKLAHVQTFKKTEQDFSFRINLPKFRF